LLSEFCVLNIKLMTDINFLSAEQKMKEALEAKQNILAKERAEIKLSSPAPLRPLPNISTQPKKKGFLDIIKNVFAKKQKPPKPTPPTLPTTFTAPKPVAPDFNSDQQLTAKNSIPIKEESGLNSQNFLKTATVKPAPVQGASGFMAPINATAWAARQPQKDAGMPENTPPTPLAEKTVELEEMGEEKEEKKEETKTEIKTENKFGGKNMSSLAFGKKLRNDIEINLISGETQIKEMEPQSKILIFAAVTAGMVLIFGGIFFSIDLKIKKAMTEKLAIENMISETNQKIKEANKNNKAVTELQPQLIGLQKILDAHGQARKIFDYLEANTGVGIYYTDMGVEVASKKVDLKGVALDYNQAAGQLIIFNTDKDNIKEVQFSNLTKTEEKLSEDQEKRGEKPRELVGFGAGLTLSDDFFK
jgi:hypothetical protein